MPLESPGFPDTWSLCHAVSVKLRFRNSPSPHPQLRWSFVNRNNNSKKTSHVCLSWNTSELVLSITRTVEFTCGRWTWQRRRLSWPRLHWWRPMWSWERVSWRRLSPTVDRSTAERQQLSRRATACLYPTADTQQHSKHTIATGWPLSSHYQIPRHFKCISTEYRPSQQKGYKTKCMLFLAAILICTVITMTTVSSVDSNGIIRYFSPPLPSPHHYSIG